MSNKIARTYTLRSSAIQKKSKSLRKSSSSSAANASSATSDKFSMCKRMDGALYQDALYNPKDSNTWIDPEDLAKANFPSPPVTPVTPPTNKYSRDNLSCHQCNAARKDSESFTEPEDLEITAYASSWLTHITIHCDTDGFARGDCSNCKNELAHDPNYARCCSGYSNNFGNPSNCPNIQYSLSDRCFTCQCPARWHPKCADKQELPVCLKCRIVAADMIKHYGAENYYHPTAALLAHCNHTED